jgi:hypothetical protein
MDQPPEKTIEEHFRSWESSAFGYGYGTGEPHVLAALQSFLAVCPDEGAYDYRLLEIAVGPTVAWLLISTLCRQEALEYGGSPRFAWLTDAGKKLKAFVCSHSVDDLVDLVCQDEGRIDICCRDACNCGPEGYEKGRVCPNPFWGR